MKLRLFSDLHLELQPRWHRRGIAQIDLPDAKQDEIAVLAGDINADELKRTLLYFADRFREVLFVPGNHEFWGRTLDRIYGTMRSAMELRPNLHCLHRDVVVIDGQRFLGTTLWFPPTRAALDQQRDWSDFRRIRGLQNEKTGVYHENALNLAFLRREMQEGDVVVTHHLPSWRSVEAKYAAAPTNAFYVCDVEDIILEKRPRLWMHGHTHESQDYTIGSTRIVCNPYGYLGYEVNPRFNPELSITIP